MSAKGFEHCSVEDGTEVKIAVVSTFQIGGQGQVPSNYSMIDILRIDIFTHIFYIHNFALLHLLTFHL